MDRQRLRHLRTRHRRRTPRRARLLKRPSLLGPTTCAPRPSPANPGPPLHPTAARNAELARRGKRTNIQSARCVTTGKPLPERLDLTETETEAHPTSAAN